MVSNIRHVWRKECLVLIVYPNADVSPPQECLRERRPVVQSDLRFYIGFPRMQADTHHAFHALHGFVLTQPDRDAPVLAALNCMLRGHVGGWPVVLRPIEFDTA